MNHCSKPMPHDGDTLAISHLVAVFTEHALGTLSEWTYGAKLRSTTIKDLRSELITLAGCSTEVSDRELAQRAAAAAGVALAVSCRTDDSDFDTTQDREMVGHGASTFEMYLKETSRAASAQGEAQRWAARIPERFRDLATDLADEAPDLPIELISCAAVLALPFAP